MPSITVVDEHRTVEALSQGKSIGRFGDGELRLIIEYSGKALLINTIRGRKPEVFGSGGYLFARRLKEVLHSDCANFLVGVPNIFYKGFESKWKARSWRQNHERFRALLDPNSIYYSAFFGIPNRRDAKFSTHWQRLSSIWENKSICIVNFNKSIVNHALFQNSKTISFVPCPQRAAWKEYDAILKSCNNTQCDLFLVSMGPVATVLAYDIAREDRQCIDIGQMASWYNKMHGVEREHLY